MPLLSSNTLVNYSTKIGSVGNTNISTPAASLGGFLSTTTVPTNVPLNLFPALTGDQNFNLNVDYLCVFVLNNHSTLTWYAPKLWLSNKTANSATIDVGIDPTAATVLGASNQAVTINSTNIAPAGVTFSTPGSKSSGLSLGDIPAGRCRAIWFRRTAQNAPPVNPNIFFLNIEGDGSQ